MEERLQHFGVWIKKSEKNKISREHYAHYDDKYIENWGEHVCKLHQEKSLINFDKNMEYFRHLSYQAFEKELDKYIISRENVRQIFDLNECKNMCGIYVMVLDEYKQIYIGQSDNIKRRIMSHWSKRVDFERLLWGGVNDSVLSINSFGALDTTRIFVIPTRYMDYCEKEVIAQVSSQFKLNRIGGGTLKDDYAIVAALAESNYRPLHNYHNESYADKYEKERIVAYFKSKKTINIDELYKGDIFCMERTNRGKLSSEKYYGEVVKKTKTRIWVYKFCGSTLEDSCDVSNFENSKPSIEEIRIKKTMVFSKVDMVKKKEIDIFWRSKKFPELEA